MYHAPRYSLSSVVVETAVTTSRSREHMLLLTRDVEQQLVTYIDKCKALAHPVTINHVRLKAQRLYYATHNIPVTAQNCNEMPSRHWWAGLKSRHPTLTLRAPQLLALQRARATQPEIINHFYDLLKLVYDTYRFQPHQIWAMDETGLDNNFKVSKVIARLSTLMHTYKQKEWIACHCAENKIMTLIWFLCLGDRRVPLLDSKITTHMSIMHICNANGISLPPMYVFAGKHLTRNMLEGAPPGTTLAHAKMLVDSVKFYTLFLFSGSLLAFQTNGSFTTITFCDVIRHLLAHTTEGPALLILDGHNSHHDIDALDL